MTERNVVRQYLQRAGSGATKAGLAATLVLSMSPALAIAQEEGDKNAQEAAAITATNTDATASEASKDAQTSSSIEQYTMDDAQVQSVAAQANASLGYDLAKIADGTYTGTATADSNDPAVGDNEWDVDNYEIKVAVEVASGKIASVKVADETYDALTGESWDYLDKAEHGNARKHVTGMADKIVEANGTSVDAVSTATVSSNAIKAAVDNALQTAYDEQNPSTPATDEYTYGYAGLTWAEYWAGENAYNATNTSSSSEADRDAGNGVYEYDRGGYDVVTRATFNHGLHRGSYQCTDVIKTAEGKDIYPSYYPDSKSFVDVDGNTFSIDGRAKTVTAADGTVYTMTGHEVTGLKYVPVKIKTSDLEAFKARHSFVANGETLAGGYGEQNLQAYSGLVAAVDADTNGLKTVTNNNGAFSFSAAVTGTDSGIEGQELKTATGIEPAVKDASGSYGEFLRVDLNGDYGDLGANMQSVTWTYYGDDATYTNALATYGTKFAADNWMHKSMGIQLGLTKSERCQLPEGTNGTGYWKLTVHALGYNDYTYEFQATDDNIVGAKEPVTEETKAQLQDLYDKAAALDKSKYTEDSWTASAIEAETAETKDLLAKKNLGESEAAEQITHLQAALDALVSLYPEAGDYVLMNIPYADFYAAESNNAGTDVVTSATKQKTRSTLASGSYHVNSDGTDISGVTFAVKVGEGDIDWSKFTRVTDDSSVTITTSIKGKESTTTYTGKSALFESASYSYYMLSAGEVPTNYKELTSDSEGNLSFGAVEGKETTELANVTANFKTSSKYGDYEIDFKNLREQMVDADGNQATVYGAVVNAADADGTIEGYGMRAVENIWKGKEIAWSCGLVKESHGSPLSSRYYTSMMGKTIKSVTFYTSMGTYTVAMDQYVPVKDADAAIKAEDASLDGANATVNADVTLPEGFDAAYQIDGQDVEPLASNARSSATVTFDASALKPGSHTLTAIDKKGKFADISTSFTATTSKLVASFDAANLKLIATNDATDDDVANYVGNITKVTVNSTEYSAQGRGAVKIFNADGSLNLAAAKQDNSLVFDANGDYQIEIEATGYTTNLGFTYTKSADKTALNAAVEAAAKLSNDKGAYTAASWAAFQNALTAAQGVNESVAATDDEVANALSALQNAQAALAATPTSDQLSDLRAEIEAGANLNKSDYTAESWAAYQKALEAANALFGSDEASATDVERATQALKDARNALAKPTANSAANQSGIQSGAQDGSNQGNSNNQDKNSGAFVQTNDSTPFFAAAAGVAAFAAAVVGAFAAARRRLIGR
ncbi:penicillin-binding Tp47 domain C-containing protein [uncultured Slackia sp.]|uniref:penicillin-binding Tp47 domain C-containing protein n=1 Tax=uncultured Slackia sp. TaxID=665903 RepID=UPI0026006BF5|nr:penicillin-binding Tp47 domain C-containing protein [uncultured Slackia sp.]